MALDEQTADALHDLPSNFKKGYKTTEFWQSTVALLIPVAAFAARIFGYDVDTEVLVASFGGLIPSGGYIIGRSWLKRKRVDGVVDSMPVE